MSDSPPGGDDHGFASTVHESDADDGEAVRRTRSVRPRATQTFGTPMGRDLGGDADSGRDAGAPAPRYSRRLSDKILIAFHHACDQTDFEVAEQLLRILEVMLTRRPLAPDGNRRRSMESLVAAHERLWHLRHPSEDQY